MGVDEATVRKVEVFGGCRNGHDPVLPESSASELAANVGSSQSFLDSGNGETDAVLGSSVEALG